MFEINGTLLIFVISFLIFMVLLNEIMLKPVGKVIKARQDKVEADLEAGKVARGTAETLFQQYEQDLKKIRGEAQAVITKSLEDATAVKNSELGKVMKEGQEKLAQAKAAIAGERANLIDGLVAQEAELVETITQKVLGEPVHVNLDAGQVRRTLEEAC